MIDYTAMGIVLIIPLVALGMMLGWISPTPNEPATCSVLKEWIVAPADLQNDCCVVG